MRFVLPNLRHRACRVPCLILWSRRSEDSEKEVTVSGLGRRLSFPCRGHLPCTTRRLRLDEARFGIEREHEGMAEGLPQPHVAGIDSQSTCRNRLLGGPYVLDLIDLAAPDHKYGHGSITLNPNTQISNIKSWLGDF